MKKLLTNNLALKIISVLIGIIIWYVVVETNDPIQQSKPYEVAVQFTNTSYIEDGKQTFLVEDDYQTVKVLIRDSKSRLSQIQSSDISVVADLTQIVKMDENTNPVYVPLSVSCSKVSSSAEIILSRQTVPITLESVKQEPVTVVAAYKDSKPAKGYEVGTMTPNPESVTISGPESIINKISYVLANVNVDGMTTDGVRSAEVTIIDKNGETLTEPSGSSLRFGDQGGNLHVDVSVTLWKRKSDVKLVANYSGEPARGYQVTEITTTPSEITVAGSEEALAKLEALGNTITIPGDLVSVEGASGDIKMAVDIPPFMPEDMKVITSSESAGPLNSISVNVTVLPNGSKEFELDVAQIQKLNLDPNLIVAYNQAQVAVRVKASDADLDAFSVEQMAQASIDLRDKTAGNYDAVPVKIVLPEGYELVDESVTVSVKLQERVDSP